LNEEMMTMNDAIEEMKIRAGLLLKQVRLGNTKAARRVAKRGRELQPGEVQRKHCLDVIAREFGFSDFRHARVVITADGEVPDFGGLLYDSQVGGTLNHWFATYAEALECHHERGGYLLPYRSQFLVVDASFVRDLGLDPQDEAWELMGRDWVRPNHPDSRRHLYAALVGATAPEGPVARC
jgi:hypothetical protein